jgi:hypothetical protein
MRQWLKYIFSGCPLLVAIVGQVLADPLSEAQQAYLQGDYTKAVELVRPLAEQVSQLFALSCNLAFLFRLKLDVFHVLATNYLLLKQC